MIMTNSTASRGFRAALFAFSGALLFGLSACNNTYGPPIPGQPLSYGQQQYLNNIKAQEMHDARRSDSSNQGGALRTR
jgi:hypothetical protein